MSEAARTQATRRRTPERQRREPPGHPDALSDDEAARLRAALTRIAKGLRSRTSGDGLSPSALDVLGTVVRRGPIRMSDLAALDALNPTMLSRLAAKLEERGLVCRLAHPGDGRSISLEATPAGTELHARVVAERMDVLVAAAAALNDRERRALAVALPALESIAETLRPRAQPESAARP